MRLLRLIYALGAAVLLCSCFTFAGTPSVVHYSSIGTNGGGLAGRFWTYKLVRPTLANNKVFCGINYSSTSATVTTFQTDKGDNFSSIKSITDTTSGYTTAIWGVAATTSSQIITFTLSAAEFNFTMQCVEVAFVTLTADKTFGANNSGVTGASVAAGSQTTAVSGDFIFQWVVNGDGGNGLGFVTKSTGMTPGSGFTIIGPDLELGIVGQWQVQSAAGAINPTMTIAGTGADTFDTVAIAMQPDAVNGTLAPAFDVIAEGTFTIPNSIASPRIEQVPCTTGQFIAFEGSTNATVFDLYSGHTDGTTLWSDSEGNTYKGLVGGGTATNPQIVYATNITCTNSNTRTVSVAFTDGGSPDPVHWFLLKGAATSSPLDTGLGTPTCIGTGCANTCAGGTAGACVISGNQSGKALSNTSCANSGTSNTGFTILPTVSSGWLFASGYTGSGPICGNVGSTAGITQHATWFQTLDDASTGLLDSSSGYISGPVTNTTITSQDNWANSAAAGASSFVNIVMVVKQAPASSVSCTMTMMGTGPC